MRWWTQYGSERRRLLRFFREYRALILVAIATGAFALAQWGWRLTPQAVQLALARVELASVDFRFHLRGKIPAAPQIAMVGVTSSSLDPNSVSADDRANSEALQLMNERPWPWNRKVFALLLEKLFTSGARVVALDFVFAHEADGDAEFAAVLKKYQDRVLIGSAMGKDSEDTTRRIYLPPSKTVLPESGPNIIGYTLFRADVDDVLRRVSYHTSTLRETGRPEFSADDLTSLGALAFEKFSARAAPPSREQLINFVGGNGTYPLVPIEDVFTDRIFFTQPKTEFGKIFQDKIVFVGPAAEVFHDVHNTPFGVMPGVEIHANVAANLLRNDMLRDAPQWSEFAATLALIALAVLILLFVRHAVLEATLLVSLGLLFAALSQVLFVKKLLVMPMVLPLCGLVFTGGFSMVLDLLVERWERTRIRGVLDRYVSRNVADRVLADSESFENVLRGQKRCVTALFSDIRGFTTMTEQADAEQLVAQLNEYFFKMVDSVLHEGGTLQKFIGDAIMAVWGDTHSLGREADAERAVRTGLMMRRLLTELNAAWANMSARRELKNGIGIHHGEVIVGNIGHPVRMEFTVLGDGINTAARLESATKQLGVDMLVGGSVEELTREKFTYRRVDLLRLKGKTKPVEVFTPLSDSMTAAPEWLAEYHRAIGLYRSRDFDVAEKVFASLGSRLDSDFLLKMYRERCAEFLKNPPPESWDGSCTLTEK